MIAVTATASKKVAADVKKILQLKSAVAFSGSFDRLHDDSLFLARPPNPIGVLVQTEPIL